MSKPFNIPSRYVEHRPLRAFDPGSLLLVPDLGRDGAPLALALRIETRPNRLEPNSAPGLLMISGRLFTNGGVGDAQFRHPGDENTYVERFDEEGIYGVNAPAMISFDPEDALGAAALHPLANVGSLVVHRHRHGIVGAHTVRNERNPLIVEAASFAIHPAQAVSDVHISPTWTAVWTLSAHLELAWEVNGGRTVEQFIRPQSAA